MEPFDLEVEDGDAFGVLFADARDEGLAFTFRAGDFGAEGEAFGGDEGQRVGEREEVFVGGIDGLASAVAGLERQQAEMV